VAGNGMSAANGTGAAPAQRERPAPPRRLETDPDQVEHDLVCLVLSVVELIRQLMERQAARRIDDDGLSPEQVEAVGLALMRLDEGLTRLKDHFGVEDDELNLSLGPLGSLL
jgi:hypothetical protein